MQGGRRSRKEAKLRAARGARRNASGGKATRLDSKIAQLERELYEEVRLDPAYPIGEFDWRYQGETAQRRIRKEVGATERLETGITPSGEIVSMRGPTASSIIRCTLSESSALAHLDQYAVQRFVVLEPHPEAEKLRSSETERPDTPELRLRNSPTRSPG